MTGGGRDMRVSYPVLGTPSLDRLIHERVRLGIASALAVNESLTFNELKSLLKTSDGNLSVHARRLEEAQYIVCTKSFAGRVPKSEYRLTPAGRKALERYLDHMEALIRATRERSSFFRGKTLPCQALFQLPPPPCTSPSSWMATDAGRPSAACHAAPDIMPASRSCAASSKPLPTSESVCSRSTRSRPPTGGGPSVRFGSCSGCCANTCARRPRSAWPAACA